jgi:hypothetical protein
MPETWTDRLESLFEGLSRSQDVVVLSAHIFPPAPESSVKGVEDALGIRLSEEIRSLYKAADGFQLRWIRRDNPRFDPVQHRFQPGPFDLLLPWSGYLADDGVINVLPIAECFLRDWKGFLWFGREHGTGQFLGNRYKLRDLRRSLRPFDAFANDYSMIFVTVDRDPDPKLLLAEDHLANFLGSKVTDAISYVKFLLASGGEVAARRRAYSDTFDAATRHQSRIVVTAADWADQSR